MDITKDIQRGLQRMCLMSSAPSTTDLVEITRRAARDLDLLDAYIKAAISDIVYTVNKERRTVTILYIRHGARTEIPE